MIDSAAGETSAPPSPCSARAATSQASVVARPFRSDVELKIATRARNNGDGRTGRRRALRATSGWSCRPRATLRRSRTDVLGSGERRQRRSRSVWPLHEHTFVHSPAVRQAARDLIAQGLNDCEVARRLGVARETVRDWRAPRYVPQPEPAKSRWICFRCWRPTSLVLFTPGDYAELLGLYLGDGHITQMARAQRLRLMLDAKYPLIVREAADLLARVVPCNKVGRQYPHEGRMVTLHAYHQHWACLFPQHDRARSTTAP